MVRSLKKGPFVAVKLLKKVMHQKELSSSEPVKTWARACTIIPEFVNHNFLVHNGKEFKKVYVTENMVGHKLGEFAPTRTFRAHAGTKKAAAPGAAPPPPPAK
ncbi:MAG: 30S ribosomal protein S19 [Planctomycetes bacterium]|nr:30S ribosomal protein S19 [Planctomycetota bacterium]